MKPLTLFLLLLTSTPQLSAQTFSFDFSGYAKNLTIRSTSALSKEAFILNTSRLRLKSALNAGSFAHAELWLDNELLAGDFLQTVDYAFSKLLERPTFYDLDWTVNDGDKHLIRQSLFRAFVTLNPGAAAITLGRQRIAWGTGFAWNPTDLFNPFNPSAIELDEKQGVDAVHATLPIGDLSRIEAAFTPKLSTIKPSYAAKLITNLHEYDVSFIAGKFRGDAIVGGDFAGYIGDAGFRGELAYTFKKNRDNYLRAVLNADYNFPHNFYALVEFYYNGPGASNQKDYDIFHILSGESFNLAKLYSAFSVTKSITPLLNASVYSIINLVDHSSLLGPGLTWSLATNLDVSANTYFLFGADDSEYGQLETSYFASVQFFF